MLLTDEEQKIIDRAVSIYENAFKRDGALTSPTLAQNYLRLKIGAEAQEHFGVLFLDTQHQVISFEVLHIGTVNSSSVYPRDITRRALILNASACIISHNHPSGVPEPSNADRAITVKIKEALAVFSISLLDHVVVTPIDCLSFAQRGLL